MLMATVQTTDEERKSKLVTLGGLAIPPLHEDELIGEWRPLFMAAVIPLMERKEEEKIIQMLPLFICRRPAERQLVREVVEEVRTIEDAFQILIENLDPPSDPQQEMLKLCRSDRQPGQPIDDFFYQLKSAATRANAPLHIKGVDPGGARGAVAPHYKCREARVSFRPPPNISRILHICLT